MVEIMAVVEGVQILSKFAKPAQAVATFAMDQGIRLFFTKRRKQIKFEEKENNMMDKAIVFNKLSNEDGLIRFIPLEDAADTCLKQIENLRLILESTDFATSLDYLSDAWRALSGNNIKLFKESICESFRFARIAKTKITKNPNHLLGVYSIIIFCGFCKFSEWGKDMYLGLKHIRDTLIEMASGTNNQSLLTKELIRIIKTKIYWKQTQKMYIKNIILFSIRLRVLVQQIIKYSEQNDANTNHENEMKGLIGECKDKSDSKNQQFGDMISILFPNATLSQLADKTDLLNYLQWTPNIMNGKYFGGDFSKIFTKIDFWNRIYPLVFEAPETICEIDAFIDIYRKDLVHLLLGSTDVAEAMQWFMTNDVLVVEPKHDVQKIKKVALCLTLHKIIADDEYQIRSYHKPDFGMPTKLVLNGYSQHLDVAFSSLYFMANTIVFAGNKLGIERFCDILQNDRRVVMDSVTEICVKYIQISLTFLNRLLWLLDNMCTGLKVLTIESLVVENSFGNTLNLDLIPKTLKSFSFNDVKFVSDIPFSCTYSDNDNNKRSSLRLMDLSCTQMTKNNFNVLINEFVKIKCENMTKIILCNCGILNSFLLILSEFYQTNKGHKLSILDLSNDKVGKGTYINGKDNLLTTEGMRGQLSNNLKCKWLHITYNNQYEKMQMVANMGQIAFVSADNAETMTLSNTHYIDSKETTRSKDNQTEYILDKIGEKKGKGKWSPYKIRQLKLTKNGFFEYYDGQKLKARFDLKNDDIVSVSINDKKGKTMKFGWEIATQQRNYYFAATNYDERDEWIENIQRFRKKSQTAYQQNQQIQHNITSTNNDTKIRNMFQITKETVTNLAKENEQQHQVQYGQQFQYEQPQQQQQQYTPRVVYVQPQVQSGQPQQQLNQINIIVPAHGWIELYTDSGLKYYQNEITKKTQWERPMVMDVKPQQQRIFYTQSQQQYPQSPQQYRERQ